MKYVLRCKNCDKYGELDKSIINDIKKEVFDDIEDFLKMYNCSMMLIFKEYKELKKKHLGK